MEEIRLCRPPLLFFLLWSSLELCSSLNDEGRALLKFRERVEIDPSAALSNWVDTEGPQDPCSWFGVGCEDGGVTTLNLKGLCLEGTLAPELGKLSHLKILLLQNNSFYGVIPKEFGELQKLEILDIGYNNLSGPIPSGISGILSLKLMKTKGNHFLDSMSSDLNDLSVISKFVGDSNMPASKAKSSKRIGGNATIRRILQLKDLEKNGLSDYGYVRERYPARSPPPLPKVTTPLYDDTPLPTQSPSSKSRPTSPELVPASSPSPRTNVHPKHSSRMVAIIGIGLGVFIFLGLLIVLGLYYRGNKVVTIRPWTTGLSGQLQKAFVTGLPQLKRSELETACEDFSNIIGSSSDCMLYKGTLSSGVEIAVASTLVTSAKEWSRHSETQFRRKIATLSKINHKNFVNLLGYCEQEDPFTRMLVFEYAPNGTLFEHLHVEEVEDLNWAARLRISMGVAYCLDHLSQLKDPVCLGNLQSSSIYLTDDFAAKVADFEFGSETMVAETDSAQPVPLDRVILDPPIIVYKFGLLLLEIISGRPPRTEIDGTLLNWASNYRNASKPLVGIIDPTLNSFQEQDVYAIYEVICRCCNPAPEERPKMKDVVCRLREITTISPDGASPKLSPLWWAELEILSTEAN